MGELLYNRQTAKYFGALRSKTPCVSWFQRPEGGDLRVTHDYLGCLVLETIQEMLKYNHEPIRVAQLAGLQALEKGTSCIVYAYESQTIR